MVGLIWRPLISQVRIIFVLHFYLLNGSVIKFNSKNWSLYFFPVICRVSLLWFISSVSLGLLCLLRCFVTFSCLAYAVRSFVFLLVPSPLLAIDTCGGYSLSGSLFYLAFAFLFLLCFFAVFFSLSAFLFSVHFTFGFLFSRVAVP